jgi:hypothetical protein
MHNWSPPLLSEISAELADEIVQQLIREGEHELSTQVPTLRVKSRCRCGDDFCATMHTGPQPSRGEAHGPSHRCVPLDAADGMIVLDVVDEKIVTIEVLDRPAVREQLRLHLPD